MNLDPESRETSSHDCIGIHLNDSDSQHLYFSLNERIDSTFHDSESGHDLDNGHDSESGHDSENGRDLVDCDGLQVGFLACNQRGFLLKEI